MAPTSTQDTNHPLLDAPADDGAGAPVAHPPAGAPVPNLSDARGGGLRERSPQDPPFTNRVASDSEAIAIYILHNARAC